MIRTTNDEKAGRGATLAESILNDQRDTENVGEVYGMRKVYHLYYRNHQLDIYDIQDLKGRLIFLFRLLKVDTVVSFDPWGHYEENPDHYVTARAVEAARWMAGNHRNSPEHFDAGVAPHQATEQYYFARGPQLVNRAARLNTSPHGDSIGRGMKVNKEEILGMLGALERYLNQDHAAERREFDSRAETISRSATAVPGVEAEIFVPEVANHVPHERLSWDPERVGIGPEEVIRHLREGEPSIRVRPEREVVVGVWMMRTGEDKIVARSLREVLGQGS